MFWIVSMLIGTGIGMLCDFANSKLNDRPYQFRINVGINDTPSTRQASGNMQNDNLQRLLQNKKECVPHKKEVVSQQMSAVQREKEENEQKKLSVRKKIESLATGLMQIPNPNRVKHEQLEKSHDKDQFSRVDQILKDTENEQRSKLLCPQKVQKIAMELVSEIANDLLFHGNAMTVPSMDSDEFKKFRGLMRKKVCL
jgi:hypothetical protein